MTDQAERLRNLVQQHKETIEALDIIETRKQELIQPAGVKTSLTSRVVAITSGKGGVGKTNLAVNLAIFMRKLHKRVTLLDTDFGLANVEVLCGVNPKYNFGDVLEKNVSVESALAIGPMGMQFLSGGSGLTGLSNITEEQMSVLIDSFAFLDAMADFIIIDTGAGVSKAVVNFVKAANEAIVITTPDPTSITDAYALIKTIHESCGGEDAPEFKLVVNRVDSPAEGVEIYEKLGGVCGRFLGVKLTSLGSIPYDPHLVKAVKAQQPVSLIFPGAASSRCIEAIASKMINVKTPEKKNNIKSFIMKLTGKRK